MSHLSVKFHEAFCLDSMQDQLVWWDDFLGDQVQDEWGQVVGATGTILVVDQQTGGICRLNCPAAGDTAYIYWNNIRSLHVDQRLSAEIRVAFSAYNNDRYFEFYLYFDVNNHIMWRTSSAAAGDFIRCVNGGAATLHGLGNLITDTNYHIIRIECHTHGGSHVHFYLDGTETANSPITTNVPDDATDFLQPRLYGLNLNPGAGGSITYDVDYVVVRQDV